MASKGKEVAKDKLNQAKGKAMDKMQSKNLSSGDNLSNQASDLAQRGKDYAKDKASKLSSNMPSTSDIKDKASKLSNNLPSTSDIKNKAS